MVAKTSVLKVLFSSTYALCQCHFLFSCFQFLVVGDRERLISLFQAILPLFETLNQPKDCMPHPEDLEPKDDLLMYINVLDIFVEEFPLHICINVSLCMILDGSSYSMFRLLPSLDPVEEVFVACIT